MPLYLPVDFKSALLSNQKGVLAADQIAALSFMLKARKITGVIIFWTELFMTIIFGVVVWAGDWQQQLALNLILLAATVLSVAGVIYGWRIWQTAKTSKQSLSTLSIEKKVGEAQKYNYGTPVKLAGATHTVVMSHGYVKIAGQKYGVLNPQLYYEIIDGKKAEFYIAPIHTVGFYKGVVVGCSN